MVCTGREVYAGTRGGITSSTIGRRESSTVERDKVAWNMRVRIMGYCGMIMGMIGRGAGGLGWDMGWDAEPGLAGLG